MENAYIYTRVSTLIQVDGFSLEAQEAEIRAFAEARKINIVGKYTDEGKSGKNAEHRPAFTQMMEDIRSKKDNIRSIDVLRTGKFNHRLLSELICHKDFQRFMLDAEIYVDRIADMRVNDMNAVLEAVRQMALMKNGGEENDLHLRTLEVAQIREDEYFGSLIADDLKGILRDIRSEHRPDTMTADEISLAATMQDQLQDAMNFEGSSEEKKAKALLSILGIDYDAITMEQFVNLIEVLKLSKHLKTPISQRGKTTMTHGKGKRKKR